MNIYIYRSQYLIYLIGICNLILLDTCLYSTRVRCNATLLSILTYGFLYEYTPVRNLKSGFYFLIFSLGGSTGGENDLWQGLKAPSTYHDQRSKFRQQASPYVRPT